MPLEFASASLQMLRGILTVTGPIALMKRSIAAEGQGIPAIHKVQLRIQTRGLCEQN
jgi:hypothetical protein